MIGVVDKFNMVDMGGIDIVESQGLSVEGLYSRLLTAIQNCRYQVLYNWKFAKIEIAPSYVELVFDGTRIYINEAVSVTEDDVVHIYSIEPEPVVPVIEPLTVAENGVYEVQEGVDGFNPVTVNVASSLLVDSSLAIVDGEYAYENLSTPGTPYIKDGNFGATSSQALTFAVQVKKLVEMEFDFWPTTIGRTLSFGGSNSLGGTLGITTTQFFFYAQSTRFSVSLSQSMEAGVKYHILLKIYPDRIELYVDGELSAIGVSNYANNIINRIFNAETVRLLQNQSSSAEYSTATMNNISIRLKGE